MASKKKPIESKTANIAAETKIEVIGFEPPPARPAGRTIDGADAAEEAKALVKALREEIKAV